MLDGRLYDQYHHSLPATPYSSPTAYPAPQGRRAPITSRCPTEYRPVMPAARPGLARAPRALAPPPPSLAAAACPASGPPLVLPPGDGATYGTVPPSGHTPVP